MSRGLKKNFFHLFVMLMQGTLEGTICLFFFSVWFEQSNVER